MTNLTDKIALVTGAGSGIGKAIALALAAQGTRLWLAGRTLEKLEVVARSAASHSIGSCCMQIDLTDDAEIDKLTANLRRDPGQLDLLIHCAGHIALGSLASSPITELDRHYQINVRAPYLLTQALLPMLRERKGQVVFINSSAGLVAGANIGQYAATKHALRAIADSLRQEVNPEGIRVLSVYPGRTASPMQAAIHATEGKRYEPDNLIQPEDVATVVVNALTLPRSAETTDIHIRPFLKP